MRAVDLLGNGTSCLVWSSKLPGDSTSPMVYLDILQGRKPHLLTKMTNNLGVESSISYAPSTKFYLEDQLTGNYWLTKIPFPVQCVERLEFVDRISGNRLVKQYNYHEGYFDGVEREFRGFGMVEEWDTEDFATFSKVD